MANHIFEALLREQIEIFMNSFSNTSKLVFFDEETKKLIHPGEFGVDLLLMIKEILALNVI